MEVPRELALGTHESVHWEVLRVEPHRLGLEPRHAALYTPNLFVFPGHKVMKNGYLALVQARSGSRFKP